MMLATGFHEDGRPEFLIGLTHHVLQELRAGRVLTLTRASHGEHVPDGIIFYLAAGQDEDEIERHIRRAGLAAPDLGTKIERRLTDYPEDN